MAKYSSHLPRDSYTDCFFKAVPSIHKGNFRQAQMVRYVNSVTVHICVHVLMCVRLSICVYVYPCMCMYMYYVYMQVCTYKGAIL